MMDLRYLAAGLGTGVLLAVVLAVRALKKDGTRAPRLLNDREGGEAGGKAPGDEGKVQAALDAADREPDREKAAASLENAIREDPRPVLRVRLAQLQTAGGDVKAAAKTLAEIGEAPEMSMYHRAYGELYTKTGDYKKAEHYLNEAVRLSEDDANRAHACFSAAQLYLAMQEPEKARQSAQKAQELLPHPYFAELVARLDREAAAREKPQGE